MKSVGIDIGSSSIKVVEVTANNKGQLRITQFLEHPLGQNPVFDPEIEIIEFLKGFAKTYSPAEAKFVFGLRQENVSVRHKIFPFNDRIKINKSLPFELEEDLPYSAETAIYDAKIIRTMGSSAEVLACATPKSRIQEILKRFGDIGFDISVLSAEGVAFANCFERWEEAPPASTHVNLEIDAEHAVKKNLNLIISIGHSRTLVNAYENNRLIAVRSILWGAKNIADAIARRYELPYVEALKEMQTKAFILLNKDSASYDQIVFSDTISHQFKDLGRELKISLLEITSELNATITAAELTGGASQVLNLEAFLTQLLEIPVNKTQILDRFSVIGFERTARIDSILGVALGLAIEGVKKPRNPALQFLRAEFAKQNQSLKILWDHWGKTLRFALAAYVAFFIYSVLRENFSQSLADRAIEVMKTQGKSVAKLSTKQTNESGVRKYIKDQKKRIQELKNLESAARMNSAMDLLRRLSDAVPAKNNITLNVKSLSIQEHWVHIEGTVAQNSELSILQKTLTNLSLDGKVETKTPRAAAPAGSVAFAYALKMDRGIPLGATKNGR